MPYLRLCGRTSRTVPRLGIMISYSLYIFIATNTSKGPTSAYKLGTEPTRLDSNTVTFRDGPDQWSVGMGSDDSTRALTVHDDVSLDQFFARPIPIYTATWTPGSTFTSASFNPWSLFLANQRVVNKMSNYRNFSGKMHVKFLVNGNSFYYGRLMASYAPLWYFDIATSTTLASTSSLIMNSQRLKIFLDPCESQGGEMELPFMWYNDMCNLSIGNHQYLGIISVEELVALKHANGATSPMTITAFAWMSDVKLSAPTSQDMYGIVPQSGDEFGDTPISNMASSVANVAGKLSSAPMIGPYMKATSLAAGGMAAVAKMFGYSRPSDLTLSMPVRPRPLGELATTDMADPCVKLSVDSKQELSVDPRIVGGSSHDELDLKSIAMRETWVTSFVWATSALNDALLQNIRVSPIFRRTTTGPLGSLCTVPACTFAAMPFKYWRGTMRYRFQIVASNFHKGRLKFSWDPLWANAVSETNVQYSKIVDISAERDFVIDVSWGYPKTWLAVADISTIGTGNVIGATRYGTEITTANGVLSVHVLNELTTPNSAVNNDITINVFMSMCDDAEFAAPSNIIATLSPADSSVQPQSGDFIIPQSDVETEQLDTNNAPEQTESTEEFVSCNPSSSPVDLVYMGEHINSFRQLMKRYNVDYHYASITPGLFSVTTTDFPMKYGYTPYGIRGTSPNKYDTCNTTMLRYLAMAFLAYRGGVRRKYIMQSNTTTPQFSSMSITRNTLNGTTVAPTTTTLTITSATTLSDAARVLPTGCEGMAWTTTRQNQVVEAEIPFYRDVRFAMCRRPNSMPTATLTHPFIEDLTHTLQANVWTPATANIFTSMVSAAEDSSFFCFQGCQPFYISPTLV